MGRRQKKLWPATPPLIKAMRTGTAKEAIKICLQMIAEGADVNCCNDRGGSALLVATFMELEDVILAMLDKGVDLQKNDAGKSSLSMAVTKQCANVTEKLLEKGVDPNFKVNFIQQDEPLLICAMRRGNFMPHADNVRIVTALIKAGADIDATTADGKTVTEVATLLGRKDFLELIAQHRGQAEIKRQEEAQQRLNNAVNIIQGGLKDGMTVRALKKKIQPKPPT